MKPQNEQRTADIIFIIGVAMLLGAHFITNIAMWTMNDYKTDAKNYAQAFEANPLAISLVSSLSGITLMLSYIFQPAIMLAAYYLFRKKYIQVAPLALIFVAVFIFFAGLTNMLNDLGNLIGLMISRGLL